MFKVLLFTVIFIVLFAIFRFHDLFLFFRFSRHLHKRSMEKLHRKKRGRNLYLYAIPLVCLFWIILFFAYPSNQSIGTKYNISWSTRNIPSHFTDPCNGKYIYIHDLPSRFNSDILKNCKELNPWTNMCAFTDNVGLGPHLSNSEQVFSDSGWYNTNQFTVEVIFHNRMKQYECLTNDSSIASAVFVPYYAGLDVARYLWGYNTSMRDSGSLELLRWLTSKPEWKVMAGRDHFFVAGRITWDFRRLSDEENDWGTKLLVLPESQNMSALVIEASPWNSNDHGIPYPTYFHPTKDSEVFEWQDRMRGLDRSWLFSFAGAPRPNLTVSIRDRIMNQCRSSPKCLLMECDFGESKCHVPSSVTEMFQSSVFCLQPQGDSYTRRSVFDSMVAGCIPVFFHPGTAYIQYLWHLPRDYARYSVFISEDGIRAGNTSIEKVLAEIKPETVHTMREEVIRMIPKLIYADPRSKLRVIRDAFDVAIDGVLARVDGLRLEMNGAGNFSRFLEKNSWKYALVGSEKPHEWDHYFFKPKQCRPC